MDHRYTIETPENISVSYDIAGIGTRFLAAIIDSLVLIVLELLLLLAMVMLAQSVEMLQEVAGNVTVAISGLLMFALFWGYYIFFEMLWNGQTPGKRLIRVRVVREGGRPITFAASVIRNLVRVIDFLPSLYGIGVLVMFVDMQARRLGDLAGGTLVVKERASVSLDDLDVSWCAMSSSMPPLSPLPPLSHAVSLPSDTTIPNIQAMTREHYDLIAEFLRRRDHLSRESRAHVGIQLAHAIAAVVNISIKPQYAEQFLEQLLKEYWVWQEQHERT